MVRGGGAGFGPGATFGLKAVLFWLNGIAAVAGRFSGAPAGLAAGPGICDDEDFWLLFIDKINNVVLYCKKPLLSREIA